MYVCTCTVCRDREKQFSKGVGCFVTSVSFPPSRRFFKLIIEQWQAEIVVRDVKIVGNSDPCTRPLEAPFKFGTLALYIEDIDIAHSRVVSIVFIL